MLHYELGIARRRNVKTHMVVGLDLIIFSHFFIILGLDRRN